MEFQKQKLSKDTKKVRQTDILRKIPKQMAKLKIVRQINHTQIYTDIHLKKHTNMKMPCLTQRGVNKDRKIHIKGIHKNRKFEKTYIKIDRHKKVDL